MRNELHKLKRVWWIYDICVVIIIFSRHFILIISQYYPQQEMDFFSRNMSYWKPIQENSLRWYLPFCICYNISSPSLSDYYAGPRVPTTSSGAASASSPVDTSPCCNSRRVCQHTIPKNVSAAPRGDKILQYHWGWIFLRDEINTYPTLWHWTWATFDSKLRQMIPTRLTVAADGHGEMVEAKATSHGMHSMCAAEIVFRVGVENII